MSDPGAAPSFRATVSALAAGQLVSWAILYYGFTSFVLPMMRELGWSKATLMGALTFGLTIWGASSYAAGAAIDRGHGRALMTGGSLAAALGVGLWAIASQPWMLFAAWALIGAAMAATLYEPAFNVLTKRYPTTYQDGITALTLVGGFASTLSFPAAAALIAAFGWRGALGVMAAVLALVVAPVHAWALRGPAIVAVPLGTDPAATATLREALRTRAFWLLTLCFTLYSFVIAAFWAHAMPAFAAKGVPEAEALAVLVWVGPAQVAGRFVYAWVGRGISLRAVGAVVLCGLPLSMAILALSSQAAWLIVFALLYGVANGLVTIVRGGLVPQYFGRTHIGRIGGAMSAVGLLARSAAPLAVAWWLLWLPGYREVLLVLTGLGVGAVLAFAWARGPAGPGFSRPGA
jgi:MFS family permease